MKRSISALLTAVLFSAAVIPDAMAQMQAPSSSENSPIGYTPPSEQSASPSTEPTSTQTGGSSQPSNIQMSSGSGVNSVKARPNADVSYPASCPFLPSGAKPGDWEYREALQKCMYGT